MNTRTRPARYTIAGPLTVIALTAAGVSACAGAPHPGGGTPGGPTVNVCTLVPSSQVAAVTGEEVVQVIPEHLDSFPDPDSFSCTYTLSDGTYIHVVVEVTGNPDVFAANSRGVVGESGHGTSVPGVGGKAVASRWGLAVLTEKDNIVIGGVPGELSGKYAGDITLARTLISAFG